MCVHCLIIIIFIMKEFIVCLLQCGHEHRCITLSIKLKISSEITDKHNLFHFMFFWYLMLDSHKVECLYVR